MDARTATTKMKPETIAYWHRMHRCEQPDAWSHFQFREYKGGLGMSNGAWNWWARELGLLRRYPTAGHAPPLVQIRVADYGWRKYRGNWGCMRTIGYPPR
jgi:hypothetical protein